MTKASNGGKVNPAFGSPDVSGAIKLVDNADVTTGCLNSQVVQINMHGAGHTFMRIERHDADHRVRVPGLGECSGNLLGETNDLWVRGRMNPKLVKLTQGRVLRASSIQQGEQSCNAKRLSIFPITWAELILLVIVLLFKARTLDILNEFVARVNPPVRSANTSSNFSTTMA